MAQIPLETLGAYLQSADIPEAQRLLDAIRAGRTLGLNRRQVDILTKLVPTGLIKPDGFGSFTWVRS